jgi:hypothetical protein
MNSVTTALFAPPPNPFNKLSPPPFPDPRHRRAPNSGSGLIAGHRRVVQSNSMARSLTEPLHTLERLIPFCAEHAGFGFKTVHVPNSWRMLSQP